MFSIPASTTDASHLPCATNVPTATDPDEYHRLPRLIAEDDLTGLLTRPAFYWAVDENIRKHPDTEFAMLLLNLDEFKPINDVLGVTSGDKVLKTVAARLRQIVRQTDLIGRLGGDEFAILQFGGSQPSTTQNLARRIIHGLSEPFSINEQIIRVGVSLGCALAPYDGGSAEVLLHAADLALGQARQDGRGVMRFFEPEMENQIRRRRELEQELRQAILNEDFQMYYQPIMDVASNQIVAFEALVRWIHPDRGVISPDRFIPLAEETGLIVPLGQWALRTACREAATWTTPLHVAVNLSSVQLLDSRLVEIVSSALDESGLDAKRLELEITETTLMADNEMTVGILHQLREFGIQVALDDFGTGYSSINYLRRFPFDKIKIDRSFVSGADHDEESMALVRMIALLGTTLGVKTTAEGVETAGELSSVRSAGCDEIQGYLLSRPVPATRIEALLEQNSLAKENPPDPIEP